MSQHDKQLLKHLEVLKKKTIEVSQGKASNETMREIKELLETAPDAIKGKLFEKYITYLYEGVGYAVNHNGRKGDNGADVLLYHPDELDKVSIIVQTKNQKKPLTYKETKSELEQFEEAGCKIYNCYQYTLISINGFVKDCERLKRYNMKMVSWDYVAGLILDFKEDVLTAKKRTPRLELNAHNQVAYEEIVESLKHQNLLAVVRATGTGKSYLISELLYDYDDKKKLVLAPSHHILKDLKKKFHLGNKDNFVDLTYQKLINMKKEGFSNLNAELIIFDEFHRLGAKEWGICANKLKLQNPEAKIVGFSATPVRFLDNNRDMTEEFFEGQKIEELELAEAIVRRILPTPTYISSIYTLEEELKRYEQKVDQSFISNEEVKQAKQALKKISEDWENTYGVDKILAKHLPQTNENMKFIVFCEDISHLNAVNIEVQKWFNKALNSGDKKYYTNIRPYRIHSKMSGKKEELERFESNNEKNTIDLLFSVDMFNEGLHVKGVTGVILLRKTSSPTIYYQQIGRALAVGNQDPIIFDLVNNFDSLDVDDGYHFGKALKKASDEEGNRRKSDGLPVNLPKVGVTDLLEECKRLFKNMDQYLKDSWNFRYQQLKDYYKKHQDCNVPQGCKENPQLARWVSSQRQAYKDNKLSQEKIDLLNQLNFDWDPYETQWQEMYQQLKKYYEQHKNCNIPKKCKENRKLEMWVNNQRQAYKNKKLSQERIALLNCLKFNWGPKESQWNEMYQQFKHYYEQHKNCNINDKYEENPRLGRWIKTQRQCYRKNELSQERIDLLNQLNFNWNLYETQWQEKYRQLQDYFEKHRHCNIPVEYKEDPQLGRWISTQRKDYKNNRLSQEKFYLLEQLSFDWDPVGTQWQDMYQQLKKYYEQHKNCSVPIKYKEDPQLGRWVSTQRRDYKKNILSQEKFDLLEQLSFDWDPIETNWQEMYQQLKKYYEQHKNCDVPKAHEEKSQLGRWVCKQRQDYKNNKLSQEKFDLLEQLSFDWDPIETNWQDMYQQLKKYYEQHKNCNVPIKYKEDPQLGRWVCRQREVYKENSLPQERIALLNHLNFEWSPSETQWDKMYQQLKEYYKKYQDCNVPQRYEENPKLANWVNNQRQVYKKNNLSQERINLLNQLNFDWRN